MIRPALPTDANAILALNAESVHFTSPMDATRLWDLHAQAAYHRVIELEGDVMAFLLVLREGADYDSPNYRWFTARYDRFLYIDRVVVAARQQGRGLGALLYDDLFAFASESGIECLACEFDIDPPNPGSAKFHDRYGFSEAGKQLVADGKKTVSLQIAQVLPAPA